MINNNLPQKVEAKIRDGLITWVSKVPVKVIMAQGFAIIGIFIVSGFLLAFSVKPREIIVKQYFTKTDSFFGVDTFHHFKAILVDKSWGTKSNYVEPDKVPTDKKFTETVKSSSKYTPYQKKMWLIKTEESFRAKSYPDGKYHSIGFGFNLHPENYDMLKRKGKLYLVKNWKRGGSGKNATTTWDNAIELSQLYIDEHIKPHLKKGLTEDQQVALSLKAYNTGRLTLGPCCGAKKSGCGASKKSTRIVHTARRNFEWRLYHGKVTIQEWEKIRLKAADLDRQHK